MDGLEVEVRHIVLRDLPEVMLIEAESFEFPWTEDELRQRLRCRNVVGMAAEHERKVVGFAIFEMRKREIHLENLAVSAEWRRMGAGRGLIDWLKTRLSKQRRSGISLEIREKNLEGQFFFRAMGFRATSVSRAHFDNDEDAYRMVYELQADVPVQTADEC